MVKKERAWFIYYNRYNRYQYIMYDHHQEAGSSIYFKTGKVMSLNNPIIFNVEDNKWAHKDHILPLDFLHNSENILLANARALALLEKVAAGDFQAFPTNIIMPDGSIINDYKLINITNHMPELFNKEKSIPSEIFDFMYEEEVYNKYAIGEYNLAVSNLKFFSSNRLKKAVQKAKLKGLVFKDKYTCSFVDE